jgi:hypothetical protein
LGHDPQNFVAPAKIVDFRLATPIFLNRRTRDRILAHAQVQLAEGRRRVERGDH